MARKKTKYGTQPNVVPCGQCGADTIAQSNTADVSICPDCRDEFIREIESEDDHVVDCRECGEPTEISVQFDSATCTDCHREAGRIPDTTPSV